MLLPPAVNSLLAAIGNALYIRHWSTKFASLVRVPLGCYASLDTMVYYWYRGRSSANFWLLASVVKDFSRVGG